ncbi:MAG TPA: glycosyltransferase [Acidimicrobiales bacterium]|nr:glycosyltransferase [Acidimicrobiales bacterium]
MSTTKPNDNRKSTADAPSTRGINSNAGFPVRGNRISVVILSKDEPELAVTLEILRPQCEASGAECIVVDASEGRLEHIHQANDWTRWIDFKGPFWRSSTIPHQRNAGCRAARGDVIAFCDSGLEPNETWLATLTAPLLRGDHTMVCGPVYAKREVVYSAFNDAADGAVVLKAATANMAFLKSVFDEVGGFDQRLFYASDYDFVWRCALNEHPCYQVGAAGMLMDFGVPSLTLRRSWRYGRGWARLFSLHPERRVWMMKDAPERVIYPMWIVLGPLSLVAAAYRKLRWVPFAWLLVPVLLMARNRKSARPDAVVVDHIVGGASVLDESLRRAIGEMGPVVFLPNDESPYVRHLAEALTELGTPVSFWRVPTGSATLNILLGPVWAILLAWRGVRIIHVHWTYGFSRTSDALGGRLARWWFAMFLRVAHEAGLKIIWTAHNVLPHEAVFDDDVVARRLLAKSADGIIALSTHGAEELSDLFGVTNVTVIPHGPLETASSARARDDIRSSLNVDSRICFSFFGNLRPYKGVETLIAASALLGSSAAIRITGRGDERYVRELAQMTERANSSGADIQIEPGWRTDAEIVDLLAASDVCVFPFQRVDNSGSVLLALAAGRPVIIPDLASLRHLDTPGVFRYDPSDPVRELSAAMAVLANLDDAEREALGVAAREWALSFDWHDIAEQTAALYADVVRKK